MAVPRHRAHTIFRVGATAAVIATALSAGIAIHDSPSTLLDVVHIGSTIALLVVVVFVLHRLERLRRPQPLPEQVGTDLHAIREALAGLGEIRSAVDGMAELQATVAGLAEDMHRLDESLEMLSARSMRMARVLEEEKAISNGEITGEIFRLPRHRSPSVKIV